MIFVVIYHLLQNDDGKETSLTPIMMMVIMIKFLTWFIEVKYFWHHHFHKGNLVLKYKKIVLV